MPKTQSKLTIVLKVYSVLALLYAVYAVISVVTLCVRIQAVPAIIYILNAEKLVSVAVCIMLVRMIMLNRPAAALFLPCIILGTVSALTLLFFFVNLLNSNETVNIGPIAFWYIANAAVFLLIAIDARYGSKLALIELIALSALTVLQAIVGIVSLARIVGISLNTAVLAAQIISGAAELVFSPPVVIVLFLLRIRLQRKKEGPPC